MQDAYLDDKITPELTASATDYIEKAYSSITDAYYKQRLINLQTYILICLDSQSSAGDIFDTKFSKYKKLFDETVKSAINDSKTSVGLSTLSVSLERA